MLKFDIMITKRIISKDSVVELKLQFVIELDRNHYNKLGAKNKFLKVG